LPVFKLPDGYSKSKGSVVDMTINMTY
jgi:hypothetical protein